MRILLDTHLVLWWCANLPLLSNKTRALIADTDNMIFVSAVSLWEIWLKASLGKLDVPADFEVRLAREGFVNLPLTSAQVSKVALLPWHHRDPFDRMLVAQAQHEDLLLLTNDEIVSRYGASVRLAP